MKICLVVLSPRILPVCEQAFRQLPVDQFWIKGYSETEIEKIGILKDFVDNTKYDYYVIQADDSIVPLESWNNLVRAINQYGDMVITGWTEINDQCKRANVRLTRPPYERTIFNLIHRVKILSKLTDNYKKETFPYPDELPKVEIFRTYFVGWALTAIRRDILIRYPYKYYSSCGSDYPFAYRCNTSNVAMYALKDCKVKHLDANYGWRTERPITELIKWQEQIIQL